MNKIYIYYNSCLLYFFQFVAETIIFEFELIQILVSFGNPIWQHPVRVRQVLQNKPTKNI